MSKICNICQTENKDEYAFCKKCGNPLSSASFTQGFTPNPTPKKNFLFEEYDGVKTEDLSTFVRNNSDKIINKFDRMRLADSKVSWCWPAAILSYFFGFLGASMWFFYRKMYKAALLCAAVGIVITVATNVAVAKPLKNTVKDYKNQADSLIQGFEKSENLDEAYGNLIKNYTEKIVDEATNNSVVRTANAVNKISCYAAAIIFGMFSLNMYKNFAIKRIKKLNEKFVAGVNLETVLHFAGGTNGKMVWIAIALLLAANFIPAAVITILA